MCDTRFSNLVGRLTVLAIALLCSLSVFAEWAPLVRTFTPDDYDAGTQNWALLQQKNGWIYAANNYGMLEYDGSRWKLYGIGNSTVVRAIAVDTAGTVYAGGTDEFGVFRPNAYGTQEYHSLVENIPVRYRHFGEVWKIFWSEERLYVQTRNYIFLFSEENHVEVIDPGDVIRTSLLVGNEFFVATARDVYVLSANRLHALRGSEALRGSVVCALLPYSDNGVLIATDFKGIYLYEGETVQRFYTATDKYITDNQLYTMAVNEQYMAFGTVRNGVVLTNLQGQSPHYLTRENGLQNNTVLSLLFDRQDNLWVGLDKGIDCVQLMWPIERLNNTQIDYGSGYAACEYDGALYLGTNQGLYCLRNGRMTLVDGSLGQVWSISEWNGQLLCCHNRGLFEVRGNRFLPIETADGVWSVKPIHKENAIVGTYVGFAVLQYTANGWKLRHLNGFAETALYYEIDAKGHIWALTSRGVERMQIVGEGSALQCDVILPHPAARQNYSLSRVGDEVYVLGDSYLGIVGADGVLRETAFAEAHLPYAARYPLISKDGNGNLWLYCNDKLLVRTYDILQGTYAEPMEIMSVGKFVIGGFANIAFLSSGDAVVGGISGFSKINLSAMPARRQTASIDDTLYIRSVCTTSPTTEMIYGESYPQRTGGVALPSNVYSLRVEYSGSNTATDATLFETRLWPAEKEFTAPTAAAYRDFTALRAGMYRLDIRMLTPHGVVERELSISVARPWYLTTFAIILYALAGALLAAYIVWRVRRRIRLNRERIEAKANQQLHEQELQILKLENEKAQFDLRQKSQELSNMILSENNRKEWTDAVVRDVHRAVDWLNAGRVDDAKLRMQTLLQRLQNNTGTSVDWKRFEDNFDIVNDQFIRRLKTKYPWMNKQERRLCVYIKMGLQTKEIAPLLNMTMRGVEMIRYRLRQKMELDSDINLKQYFNEM